MNNDLITCQFLGNVRMKLRILLFLTSVCSKNTVSSRIECRVVTWSCRDMAGLSQPSVPIAEELLRHTVCFWGKNDTNASPHP